MYEVNCYPEEMANALYKLCEDMDREDYKENKEKEIQELEDCIYNIKCIAENEFNSEYWRTFYKCLENVCEANM